MRIDRLINEPFFDEEGFFSTLNCAKLDMSLLHMAWNDDVPNTVSNFLSSMYRYREVYLLDSQENIVSPKYIYELVRTHINEIELQFLYWNYIHFIPNKSKFGQPLPNKNDFRGQPINKFDNLPPGYLSNRNVQDLIVHFINRTIDQNDNKMNTAVKEHKTRYGLK